MVSRSISLTQYYILNAWLSTPFHTALPTKHFTGCFLITGRINTDESVLWYPEGLGSTNYTDLNYVPVILDDLKNSSTPERLNETYKLCGDNKVCQFDSLTKGTEAAVDGQQTYQDLATVTKILGKYATY